MRALIATLLLSLALPLAAQMRPPHLEPIPEPPAPPKGYELDPSLEPEVTTFTRGADVIEELRIKGRLYMVKVTPIATGVPYYLVDETADGQFTHHGGADTHLRPPMWLLHRF